MCWSKKHSTWYENITASSIHLVKNYITSSSIFIHIEMNWMLNVTNIIEKYSTNNTTLKSQESWLTIFSNLWTNKAIYNMLNNLSLKHKHEIVILNAVSQYLKITARRNTTASTPPVAYSSSSEASHAFKIQLGEGTSLPNQNGSQFLEWTWASFCPKYTLTRLGCFRKTE